MKYDQSINIGYYTKNLSGHRRAYLEFVQTKFGGERLSNRSLFLWKDPIFFLMIEDNFVLYFIVSIYRTVLGRRTVGLLFRPKPAVEAKTWKLKIKQIALKILCKSSNIQTLSIVPTSLEPEIAKIVDDWIYDFQLWDITPYQREMVKSIQKEYHHNNFKIFESYKILQSIYTYCKDKKIVIALGVQNKGKGIEQLAENITNLSQNDYCIVIAGRFAESAKEMKQKLADLGALIFDRFITDEEILALYAIADAVWCFYDPSYDQASGILGRAIQLNVAPIVRKGSFSELLCDNENIFHISAENKDDLAYQLKYFEKSDCTQQQVSYHFESLSEAKLKVALGLNMR